MKCAVSDFDRTLYVERMIGEEDKNAVLNWQKSGNLFVIATGRNLGTIKPIFESYGFSPDFWILNNGAMIADRDGKTLFTKLIPRETALAVLRYLQSKMMMEAVYPLQTGKYASFLKKGPVPRKLVMAERSQPISWKVWIILYRSTEEIWT